MSQLTPAPSPPINVAEGLRELAQLEGYIRSTFPPGSFDEVLLMKDIEHIKERLVEIQSQQASESLDGSAALAAVRTLERLNYHYAGGDEWVPPLGDPPNWDLVDILRSKIYHADSEAEALEEYLGDCCLGGGLDLNRVRHWVRWLIHILRSPRPIPHHKKGAS